MVGESNQNVFLIHIRRFEFRRIRDIRVRDIEIRLYMNASLLVPVYNSVLVKEQFS